MDLNPDFLDMIAALVRNKRATGRAKDLLDVELLRSGETSD